MLHGNIEIRKYSRIVTDDRKKPVGYSVGVKVEQAYPREICLRKQLFEKLGKRKPAVQVYAVGRCVLRDYAKLLYSHVAKLARLGDYALHGAGAHSASYRGDRAVGASV